MPTAKKTAPWRACVIALLSIVAACPTVAQGQISVSLPEGVKAVWDFEKADRSVIVADVSQLFDECLGRFAVGHCRPDTDRVHHQAQCHCDEATACASWASWSRIQPFVALEIRHTAICRKVMRMEKEVARRSKPLTIYPKDVQSVIQARARRGPEQRCESHRYLTIPAFIAPDKGIRREEIARMYLAEPILEDA